LGGSTLHAGTGTLYTCVSAKATAQINAAKDGFIPSPDAEFTRT
jgi:hypothetical protein